MAEELTGYCLKCKEHRVMVDPKPEWAANGTAATRGQCAVCGTNMYRRGKTPQHEGLPKPPPQPKAKKTRQSGGKRKKRKNGAARRNVGKLVIVESPAKAKTIGKYLGSGYTVKSSVGHIRDLLKSRLSVDVDNDYTPEYRVPNDKRAIVKELKAAAAGATEIFLATDQDREGEAIAWHVMESAEMNPSITKRVVFNEITKPAIQAAFKEPRQIDMDRVNAQQARRILDRLVGYKLSPLLWRKVRGRLSAGRVQSVAVRMVVEREREIENFTPDEYWTLEADLLQHKYHALAEKASAVHEFRARFHRLDGEKPELTSEADVTPHLEALKAATWTVGGVKLGTRRRKPAAPFTTSTLQQEASRKLSYKTGRTMRLAQQLYEGIELGDGNTVGLITYMRTDSTFISTVAQGEARAFIDGEYGKEYLPSKPPVYKTKAKGAQEAHEAIRPTDVRRTPRALRKRLSRDQYRLYTLIWERFVASQMANAVYDTVRADIFAGDEAQPVKKRRYHFRSTGSSLRFKGFLVVYEETRPADRPTDEQTVVPADLKADEAIDLRRLLPEQHFTQPPPRFSEATLVKELEENGIGRPSTYASILSTIQARGYIDQDGRRLVPTETGRVVNDLLVEYFPDVLSTDFTAAMESDLDEIADGKPWVPIIDEFYRDFAGKLAVADEKLPKIDLKAEPEPVGRACPTCGEGQLVYRQGRYGRFIGCDRFPKCRHTEQIIIRTGVTCPVGGGDIIEKRTRRGRLFYGCSRYPDCEWTSWVSPSRVEDDKIVVETKNGKVTATACELKPEAAAVEAEATAEAAA